MRGVDCHRPGGYRRARVRAGATLVDLTITVLILGILAAVAAPRFVGATNRLRAEAVARRLAADLNYARRAATRTSVEVTVTFTTAPAGYQLAGVEHPEKPGQAYAVELADLDSAVTLTLIDFDGATSVTYNVHGRPLVGGAALASGVVTATCGGHSIDVVVDSVTGEAATQ